MNRYYFCTMTRVFRNQYDMGHRGCALMSSLLKANWDRQTGRQAGTSKYRDACASKNKDVCERYMVQIS